MGEQISIGGFEARFYNVKTPMGLVLTEARVKGVNTIIGHKPLHVEMLKPGDIEAHINEQALAVFLNEEAPGGLQNFQVELKDGKIALQATMTMIIPIKAAAVCTLRIVDGRQIFVDLESVDVFGVGATGLVESHLAKVNPVLDVSTLPLDVLLKDVTIKEGLVIVTGTAQPKTG
jgi:hypothetical protein